MGSASGCMILLSVCDDLAKFDQLFASDASVYSRSVSQHCAIERWEPCLDTVTIFRILFFRKQVLEILASYVIRLLVIIGPSSPRQKLPSLCLSPPAPAKQNFLPRSMSPTRANPHRGRRRRCRRSMHPPNHGLCDPP